MLSATIYAVFCDETAAGNPCAVVVLAQWLSEEELLSIAQQLAQPVTSFVVSSTDEHEFRRWACRLWPAFVPGTWYWCWHRSRLCWIFNPICS